MATDPRTGRSPIWGGGTLGLVLGVIIGLIVGDLAAGIAWGVGLGILFGVAAALLGRFSDYGRSRLEPPSELDLIVDEIGAEEAERVVTEAEAVFRSTHSEDELGYAQELFAAQRAALDAAVRRARER